MRVTTVSQLIRYLDQAVRQFPQAALDLTSPLRCPSSSFTSVQVNHRVKVLRLDVWVKCNHLNPWFDFRRALTGCGAHDFVFRTGCSNCSPFRHHDVLNNGPSIASAASSTTLRQLAVNFVSTANSPPVRPVEHRPGLCPLNLFLSVSARSEDFLIPTAAMINFFVVDCSSSNF